jgi:hypothetical protein
MDQNRPMASAPRYVPDVGLSRFRSTMPMASAVKTARPDQAMSRTSVAWVVTVTSSPEANPLIRTCTGSSARATGLSTVMVAVRLC